MKTKPSPTQDPLARPGVVRILPGPTASATLTEAGAECFALVGRDTYPGEPSRWVILLCPVPLTVANAASRVLLGTHTAKPIRNAVETILEPSSDHPAGVG